MNIFEIFQKGGITMLPLLLLSVLALSAIVERLWFWSSVLTGERQVVSRVLEAARYDWAAATRIAQEARSQPIGRFLYAPLRLPEEPDPELFRLALEAAADDELAGMRRGDKILEAVIALAPLLGLLGTVVGLIRSLGKIRLGDLGTASTAGVTLGIGEALISTATGLIVAIVSLAFYRLFQGFVFTQIKIFRQAGNELELLYRQYWPTRKPAATSAPMDKPTRKTSLPENRLPENRPQPAPPNLSLDELAELRQEPPRP